MKGIIISEKLMEEYFLEVDEIWILMKRKPLNLSSTKRY
jgi:hypothetical protein